MSTQKSNPDTTESNNTASSSNSTLKKWFFSKERTIGKSLKRKKYKISGYHRIPYRLIGTIIVAVGLVVGMAIYLPNCSTYKAAKEYANKVNVKDMIDPEAPASLQDKLTPVLEQNVKMNWIAANTSAYPDPRIVELAIREPAAIDFVYNYPTNPPQVGPYKKGVMKGTAPILYCWDKNWGAVDYGGVPLAVTGSGPTVFSMAYMGTFGLTDKTPADMAELAKAGGYVSEKGETSAEFFTNAAASVALKCRAVDKSEQTINLALSRRHFLVAHIASTSQSADDGHWILIADHAQSGALMVHDPTSTINTNQLWDPPQLLSKIDDLYIVTGANEK